MRFSKLILKIGLILLVVAVGLYAYIDYVAKGVVVEITESAISKQESLDISLADQERQKNDAISKIKSRQSDLIPELKFVAALHPSYRDSEEEDLVRETAFQLLESKVPEEVSGALEVLSYFIDVKTMKKVVEFGAKTKNFQPETVESLSFNPFLDANDFRRGRKKENLEEFSSDKSMTSLERKIADSAAKSIR